MMPLFGLADCNNFYASVERVFDQSLVGKPVVVLSSNDGNVIARSAEAKALGIEMGTPAFQLGKVIREHQVIVRSSNFTLYGDMSSRVMQTIATLAPITEVYSIDEAFIDLSHERDPLGVCRAIRARVQQWCGIPLSVGVGETKTLAKIANRRAKKAPELEGICHLEPGPEREAFLQRLDLTDVWGIAGGLARRLRDLGIQNPDELRRADPQVIKTHLGVIGYRLVEELRGNACIPLELIAPIKKTLCVSRSFGAPIWDQVLLGQAVGSFVQRAAEKLRRHQLVTAHLSLFAQNSHFRRDEAPVHHAASVRLALASHDTGELLAAARSAITAFYRKGIRYTKAGVLCLDLAPAAGRQQGLFSDPEREAKRAALLAVVDATNARWRGSLGFAAAGVRQPWTPRAEHRSPRWTTRWDEVPVVR